MYKLKNCPFCGAGKDYVGIYKDCSGFIALCKNCSGNTWDMFKRNAVRKWNRRTTGKG